MRRNSFRFGLLALAALVIPACGEDEGHQLPVYPTSGVVRHAGAPVPGAIVRFHPTDPAAVQVPDGEQGPAVLLTTATDEQGKFSLSTYFADDGVPAGAYKVVVLPGAALTPADALADESSIENADDARPGAAKKPPTNARSIPPKYRDPNSTTLLAHVKPDAENHFVLDLD